MKKCKLILAVILLFSTLISLSGCIILTFDKYYDDIDRDKLSSIEIYDLRGDRTFAEPSVYTLKEEQIDAFLDDLAKIRFEDMMIITIAAVDPSFEWGDWAARINYTDGTYMLISSGGYGETLDANDEVIDSNHYGCEEYVWNNFVKTYLPEEIIGQSEQEPLKELVIGKPKNFSSDGITLLLTDRFDVKESELGFDAYYSAPFCGVVVLKEEFSLEEGLAEKSLQSYVEGVIENNGHTGLTPIEKDGLWYYVSEKQDTYSYSFSYKGSDAFYIVQFLCFKKDIAKYENLIFLWAQSVEVS